MFTAKRKEAYEALHPEAAHGGDRSSGQVGHLPSFSDDQAERTVRLLEHFILIMPRRHGMNVIKMKCEATMLSQMTFQTKQICAASGINNGRLQNYFARGLVMGHRDVEGGGANNRVYRWPTVMEIAVASEFVAANLPPKLAFKYAAKIAHSGHGEGDNLPPRLPGLPFHHDHGDTFILAYGDNANIACDGVSGYDRRRVLLRMGDPITYITVNVTALLGLVCQRLDPDLHPFKVLDAEYGGSDA